MVIADHRVPVPAASVAAHCGEAEVAVEVNQNLFGNSSQLFVCLIDPPCLSVLSTWKHLTCRGRVRGPDWKIERIVKDGTVGTDCCKWQRLSDQYYVSANFFHSEKETFCFHLLVRYADFTQEGGGRTFLFVL